MPPYVTGAGTLFWVEPEGLDPTFRSLTGRRRSVLAHRGALEQAEALVRTAVATAEERTDNIWWRAFTREDLAVVLERAGRVDEAREELERALTIWERKGCLPCAQRARDRIASIAVTDD